MYRSSFGAKAKFVLFVAGLILHSGGIVYAASSTNFSVTTPGSFYSINGISPNPTLTLTRGLTYTFTVNAASFHPFEIVSNPSSGLAYNNGVTGNNTASGVIHFTVPAGAPDRLFYICSIHFFMGTINIISPPPPPPPFVKVVSLSLTPSSVTLKSTGTNGWTAIPEFNSNLTARIWRTVPDYTNAFLSGTNITSFGRLEAICGPNVFLRVRNTNN